MKIAVLDINGVQSTIQGKKQHYYLVEDDYDFGGNSATDVSNIDNATLFYDLLRICYCTYREMLADQYNQLSYNSLSNEHKVLLATHMISSKAQRDSFFNDVEQKELIVDVQTKIIDCKKNRALEEKADGFITDISGIDRMSGELSNFIEMFIQFNGVIKGAWHKIKIDGVSPNSVIMVSVVNKKNKRFGGVREVGSTLDRRKQIAANTSFSSPVKTNAEGEIEVYKQNDDIIFSVTAQLS